MSHFCVAVFTDGNKTVEELLAPYQENNMGTCPIEYLEFVEDKDFDLDEKTGKRGYWENPNAKWDWYQVGGRWKGFLKAKSGEKGESSLVYPVFDEYGKYSQAKVKDVNFEQDMEAYKKALRWWEVVVEKSPLKEDEKQSDFLNYYKIEYLKEKYKTKENYAKCQSSFSTFAVITPDGKWYEKGKMGWWACVSDEDYDWDLKFKERFIDTANSDWTVTVVDCHI